MRKIPRDIIILEVHGTLSRKRSRQKVLRDNKVSENENKVEHYRQLLMLFTSWRNEKCDLMNKCNSSY